jgi:hypothetical protein
LGKSVVSLEDPFHFQLHQARVVSPCLPPPRDDISGVQPVSYVAMAIGRRTAPEIEKAKKGKEKKSLNTLPPRRMRPEPVISKKRTSNYIAQSIKGRQPPVPQPPSGIQ